MAATPETVSRPNSRSIAAKSSRRSSNIPFTFVLAEAFKGFLTIPELHPGKRKISVAGGCMALLKLSGNS
jgi:hypothetical protein